MPKGFLIDLDLAKQVTLNPITPTGSSNTLRRRRGTMLFMAIEVLEGKCSRHNWRHDLESFLYVLIWLCVTAPSDADMTARKELESLWSQSKPGAVKAVQAGMDTYWLAVMDLFAKSMKGGPAQMVACEWREVLFPLAHRRGIIMGEEGRDRQQVYKDMLAVVDGALRTCKEETALNETVRL